MSHHLSFHLCTFNNRGSCDKEENCICLCPVIRDGYIWAKGCSQIVEHSWIVVTYSNLNAFNIEAAGPVW